MSHACSQYPSLSIGAVRSTTQSNWNFSTGNLSGKVLWSQTRARKTDRLPLIPSNLFCLVAYDK